MRKFFSNRNIASFLFVVTLFIFVLAQRYTRENGRKDQQFVLIKNSAERVAENNAGMRTDTVISE